MRQPVDSAASDGARGQLGDGLALRTLCCAQTPDHNLTTVPLDSSPDFVLRPAHSRLENHSATLHGFPHCPQAQRRLFIYLFPIYMRLWRANRRLPPASKVLPMSPV